MILFNFEKLVDEFLLSVKGKIFVQIVIFI